MDLSVRFVVRDTAPVAATEPKPLRVDAARNQERILAAAREAFAEHGLDVGVQEIARRAGVGKGTLFRHFPSKDALILAIFEDFASAVEAAADRALEEDDPWQGVRAFLEDGGRMQAANMGYLDAMALQFGGEQMPANLCGRMDAAAVRVLEPARDAGLLREGLTSRDLLVALRMLGAGVCSTRDDGSLARYRDLLLAGMRASDEPLPQMS